MLLIPCFAYNGSFSIDHFSCYFIWVTIPLPYLLPVGDGCFVKGFPHCMQGTSLLFWVLVNYLN